MNPSILCLVALGILIIDHVRQEFKIIAYRRALEFYAHQEEWKADNGRVARITLGHEPEDGKWERA